MRMQAVDQSITPLPSTDASNSSKRTLTRRLLLCTAAAMPAAAIPVSALANSRAGKSAFAPLGEELQHRWATYALHRPIYEEACEKANELEYEALINHQRNFSFDDDWDEYWGLVNSTRAQTNYPAAEKTDTDSSAAVDRTVKQIMAMTPATIDDLAVIANALAVTKPELWESGFEDLDYGDENFRLLVDHVLRLAGQPLVLDGLPTPQTLDQDAHHRAREVWKQRGMSDERKREIAAAIRDQGDYNNQTYGKVFHTAAARCNCSKEEFSLICRLMDQGLV